MRNKGSSNKKDKYLITIMDDEKNIIEFKKAVSYKHIVQLLPEIFINEDNVRAFIKKYSKENKTTEKRKKYSNIIIIKI